ncbi:hypothetical protein KJ903_03280 [Patescibacteria group bacterium]|nr:hypothetical protein [Patescibacteria group bacterium]
MNINTALQKIGLDNKERQVYLALLKLGSGTVKSIAAEAKLKRPHVYNVLEDLEKKSLISRSPDSQKALYHAEHPRQLLRELNKSKQAITDILPELASVFGQHKAKPRVRLLEGVRGMEQIYEEILSHDKIDIIGNIKNVKPLFPKMVEKATKIATGKKQVFVRDLMTKDAEGLEYARQTLKDNHLIRFIPPNLNFAMDCSIYGDTVAMFSLRENLFVLVIENKDITDSFRSLYELAWAAGEEYTKKPLSNPG